ncbi:MAG: hypothetical protein ACYDHM_11190 [Acidiferrobacterales bacterium]
MNMIKQDEHDKSSAGRDRKPVFTLVVPGSHDNSVFGWLKKPDADKRRDGQEASEKKCLSCCGRPLEPAQAGM